MRLLLIHLRSGLGTSALVALLVAATVLVVALAPRALLRLGTDELRYELRTEPAGRIDLLASGGIGIAPGAADTVLGPIDSALNRLPTRLPEPLSDGASATNWLLRTRTIDGTVASRPNALVELKLAIDLQWTDRIRFVDGAAPKPWPGTAGDDAVAAEPIGIALARSTATELGAQVGDIVEADPMRFVVAGIYEPVDPGAAFWQHADDLLVPTIVRESNSPLTIQAGVFVDPDSIAELGDRFAEGALTAWIPIDPDAYEYADVELLGSQVREVTATPVELPNSGSIGLRSALDDVFETTQGKVSSISALIALSASGLLAVLIAAYALSIQAVIRRRRAVLALASARGAAPRQVRLVMMIEALAIVVPGSVAAMVAAAVVLPESVGLAGWLAPVVVALIPVALAGILTSTSALREGRDDLGSRWGGTRRWVVEIAVVALAAAALVLLQRRGLVASSAVVGIDPLLSAVPVLLAVAAGLLVLRVYPAPLRAIHRSLQRRRAPAASVGSARAVREPAVGLIGTLALITGLSVAVFTTVMISTVAHGLEQSARDELGADLQISAHDLPPSLVEDLSALPGVTAAVSLLSISGVEFSDEAGPSEVTVLLADTQALHEVRPDIPALGGKVGSELPILVSSDWADRIDGTALSVVNTQARLAGVIPPDSIPGMARHWLLADISALDELGLTGQVPRRILAGLDPGADASAVVEAATALVTAEQPDDLVGSVRVDDAQSLLARMQAAPTTSGLSAALLIVSVSTLLLTMLIVALAALTAAARRNRVVGVLRVLGMTPRHIRSLVAWEFAPVAVSAVVVGAGLGLGLPYLVTAVLDLRGFVGGNAPPQPVLDPLWVVGAIVAFVGAVVGAVLVATAAGRRLAPAGVLKMGEG
jgi:putative ABC transport system permease protein